MNRDLGIGVPYDDEDETENAFAEKRRFPRRPLSLRCWMGDGTHTLYVRLHDVSLGGLSVRAPVPFSPSTKLELALVISGGYLADPLGTIAIRAHGRVVWVRPADGPRHLPHRTPIAARRGLTSGSRMGAEFVAFTEGEELLRRLVEALG